jgi:ActR/RegA family two-component response regulator
MAKILLVEDNEMNRDMLRRRLTRRGFDVIVAVGVAVGVTVDVGVAVGVTAVIGIFKMVSQGEFDSTIIIVAVESH